MRTYVRRFESVFATDRYSIFDRVGELCLYNIYVYMRILRRRVLFLPLFSDTFKIIKFHTFFGYKIQ